MNILRLGPIFIFFYLLEFIVFLCFGLCKGYMITLFWLCLMITFLSGAHHYLGCFDTQFFVDWISISQLRPILALVFGVNHILMIWKSAKGSFSSKWCPLVTLTKAQAWVRSLFHRCWFWYRLPFFRGCIFCWCYYEWIILSSYVSCFSIWIIVLEIFI